MFLGLTGVKTLKGWFCLLENVFYYIFRCQKLGHVKIVSYWWEIYLKLMSTRNILQIRIWEWNEQMITKDYIRNSSAYTFAKQNKTKTQITLKNTYIYVCL